MPTPRPPPAATQASSSSPRPQPRSTIRSGRAAVRASARPAARSPPSGALKRRAAAPACFQRSTSSFIVAEVAGLGEHAAHHRLEELRPARVVVRVEAVLVVLLAELDAVRSYRSGCPSSAVAHVPVAAAVVRVVVQLEDAVVLDHPAAPRRDVTASGSRRHLAVRVRRELVADVVQQGRPRRTPRRGRRGRRASRPLQRVLVARHLVAGERRLAASRARSSAGPAARCR